MRHSSESTPRGHARSAVAKMILSHGYRIGDKLPPYRDLARQLGISARTLVRALHELAEEGTLQPLHGKGVFVRRMPAGGGILSTVGLVSPASQLNLLSHNYLRQILFGVVNQCGVHHIDLQIMAFRQFGRQDSTPVPPRELAPRVDGMILLGVLNDRYVAEFSQELIPLVLVDGQTQAAPVSCIAVDNAQAVNLIVDHLYGLGHRRIAYADAKSSDDLAISGEPGWLDTPDSRERRQAYLGSLRRLDLSYEQIYPVVDGDRQRQAAAVMASLKRERQLPTAIICYDDELASYLHGSLRESALRVPRDISVAAAVASEGGNLVSNQVITCAVADFQKMGEQAITSLLRQTTRQSAAWPKPERVGSRLYVGTTTGKPRRV